MSGKKYSISNRIYHTLLLGIISGIFITLFSYSSSPLYPYSVGRDAAFFRMAGQGMTQGMLPYRDFFDMKGPYLFLIEYIAQLISYGRYGIFIVQILNLWLVLYIVDKLFLLYGIQEKRRRLFMLLPLLSISALSFLGGNLTEEFSLVPLFSCVYICAGFIKSLENSPWKKSKLFLAGIWFGLMLGFLAFVRVTNASLIGGLMLVVVIALIGKKQAAGILPCAAGFIAGLFVALFPPIAFYWAKGLLNEFYEAVWVLGVSYSTEQSVFYHIYQTLTYNGIRSVLILLLALFTVLPLVFRRGSIYHRLMLMMSGIFTFFAISSGNNFYHYYALMLPTVALGGISLMRIVSEKPLPKKALAASVLAASLLVCPAYMIKKDFTPMACWCDKRVQSLEETLAKDASGQIPDNERDSVFAYNFKAYIWLYADVYPCIKYCAWQNHYIEIMPQIEQELQDIFASDPPKWLLLKPEPGRLPDFLNDALASDYKEYYSNEMYVLYRLNEALPDAV
jgi:hypothetical protein